VSKLIPIVIALILVIGVSMMLIIPTTTNPVSGQSASIQCRLFDDPDRLVRSHEICCPEGQVWELGVGVNKGETYWKCM
jgi:hypothetical protein